MLTAVAVVVRCGCAFLGDATACIVGDVGVGMMDSRDSSVAAPQ
jgi:hypothetical protein